MPAARLRPIQSSRRAPWTSTAVFQVAAFLVRHRDGLVLVDSGFPGWQYAILTAAASLSQPNRISHVILTHAHADQHRRSSQDRRSTMSAEVLCSATERPMSKAGRSACATSHWVSRGSPGSRATI